MGGAALGCLGHLHSNAACLATPGPVRGGLLARRSPHTDVLQPSSSPRQGWSPRSGARVHAKSKGSGGGRGFGGDSRLQDEIRARRVAQITATDMLAKLLQAGEGAAAVAEEYVDSLTEEFFQMSSAYMQMADKDGDAEVAQKIKEALQAAMKARQATLRPEIQLLNRLLATETPLERKQALNSRQAGDTLIMNDGYFFSLLERMTKDVRGSPEGPQRGALLEKLADIKADATDRLPKS